MSQEIQETSKIAVFKGKEIRKIIHKDEWCFSIIDVVAVLTDSSNPRRYWSDLKMKLTDQEGFHQLYDKIVQLKMESTDGKKYLTDTGNTETLFRIVQSIPSPKAEPFKRWLAKVGYERVQEIEDPELATKRSRAIYKAKGYPESWIEKRMRGIAIREQLTDEWEQRGIKEQKEYAILTAEISKATFGLNPSEYKKLKKLKKENLRDHMTDLELIFSMLGEASTTEIAVQRDTQGFEENQQSAEMGGNIAGNARKELEEKSGRKVTSSSNFLGLEERVKKLIGEENIVFKNPPRDFSSKMEIASCYMEIENKLLFLLRNNNKPQGNTWAVPAGKVDLGETPTECIFREVYEETKISMKESNLSYFDKVYVRYPEYDFIYHIFLYKASYEEAIIEINNQEHQTFEWLSLDQALFEPLISRELACLRLIYDL